MFASSISPKNFLVTLGSSFTVALTRFFFASAAEQKPATFPVGDFQISNLTAPSQITNAAINAFSDGATIVSWQDERESLTEYSFQTQFQVFDTNGQRIDSIVTTPGHTQAPFTIPDFPLGNHTSFMLGYFNMNALRGGGGEVGQFFNITGNRVETVEDEFWINASECAPGTKALKFSNGDALVFVNRDQNGIFALPISRDKSVGRLIPLITGRRVSYLSAFALPGTDDQYALGWGDWARYGDIYASIFQYPANPLLEMTQANYWTSAFWPGPALVTSPAFPQQFHLVWIARDQKIWARSFNGTHALTEDEYIVRNTPTDSRPINFATSGTEHLMVTDDGYEQVLGLLFESTPHSLQLKCDKFFRIDTSIRYGGRTQTHAVNVAPNTYQIIWVSDESEYYAENVWGTYLNTQGAVVTAKIKSIEFQAYVAVPFSSQLPTGTFAGAIKTTQVANLPDSFKYDPVTETFTATPKKQAIGNQTTTITAFGKFGCDAHARIGITVLPSLTATIPTDSVCDEEEFLDMQFWTLASRLPSSTISWEIRVPEAITIDEHPGSDWNPRLNKVNATGSLNSTAAALKALRLRCSSVIKDDIDFKVRDGINPDITLRSVLIINPGPEKPHVIDPVLKASGIAVVAGLGVVGSCGLYRGIKARAWNKAKKHQFKADIELLAFHLARKLNMSAKDAAEQTFKDLICITFKTALEEYGSVFGETKEKIITELSDNEYENLAITLANAIRTEGNLLRGNFLCGITIDIEKTKPKVVRIVANALGAVDLIPMQTQHTDKLADFEEEPLTAAMAL